MGKIAASYIQAFCGMAFGSLLVFYLPPLTSWHVAIFVAIGSSLLFIRFLRAALVGLLICFCWSSWYVYHYDAARNLIAEGEPTVLVGTVSGVVSIKHDRFTEEPLQAFTLTINSINNNSVVRYPRFTVALTHPAIEKIAPGDLLTLVATLRHMRSNQNKSSLDFERIYFAQHQVAVGKSKLLLQSIPMPGVLSWIDSMRMSYHDSVLDHYVAEKAGMLIALATGDARAISSEQWHIFNRSGTIHLISISGSHLTMIAVIIFMVMSGSLACFPYLRSRSQVKPIALIITSIFVLWYGLIAGMSIPTTRALIMFFVFMIHQLFQRTMSLPIALVWCLAIILLLHPASLLLAGTWLSFLAFSVIVTLSTRFSKQPLLVRLIMIQGVLTLLLLPPALIFFNRYAMLGSLSNLLAIPYVELVLSPLALVNFMYFITTSTVSSFLSSGFIWLSDIFITILSSIPDNQFTYTTLPQMNSIDFILAILVCILFLMLPTTRTIATGLLILSPLMASQESPLPSGAFRAHYFDVGQGQAVLLETRNHTILFDAADQRGESSYAETVIVPYLQSRGISQLTTVVISHGDADHAAGLHYLSKHNLAKKILIADTYTKKQYIAQYAVAPNTIEKCYEGLMFTYDEVSFRFFNPIRKARMRATNDQSCVLYAKGKNASLLLLGDLEIAGEMRLRNRYPNLTANVVLLGHHGSKTSSHAHFLKGLNPNVSIISTGYRNRFEFPHQEVVSVLNRLKIPFIITGWCGMIITEFNSPIPHTRCMRNYQKWRWRFPPIQHGGMSLGFPLPSS